MKSIIYLTIIIGILVTLIFLSSLKYKIPNASAPSFINENFECPKSKYNKIRKINYPEGKIIYKEDEDINYKIEVPLVKRRKPFFKGWRDFNRNKFLNGTVSEDSNFDGTPFRNYLDNLNYFHN